MGNKYTQTLLHSAKTNLLARADSMQTRAGGDMKKKKLGNKWGASNVLFAIKFLNKSRYDDSQKMFS